VDKLRAMTAFVRIAEAGSITGAARGLDTSQPALVRTLAALEAQLGARLIHRTTRRMSLTDAGRDYLERCRLILAAVEEADGALSARGAAPRGRLRITAPVPFGRSVVAPILADFLAAHPAVEAELLLLDRVVDLVEEGLDLAVRLARLPDSTLVAHPVGEVRRVVVASPALLRRTGTPREPQDLRDRACVSFFRMTPRSHWTFGSGRRAVRVPVRDVFVTNQIDAALLACERGLGVARLLSYQVADALAHGRLVRILAEHEDEAVPVSLVMPSARQASAATRVFIEFARPRIGAALSAPGSGHGTRIRHPTRRDA
jgi:DNA-binding transcriptional LysR family regulator